MMIDTPNPVLQTILFSLLLFFVVILTTTKKPKQSKYIKSNSYELRGIAILMVIFAHTGYYLAKDTRFLFPLSVFAGVGVNLFLFLSGYGLTASAIRTKLSISQFYRKRFSNIYLPMWIAISVLYLANFLILKQIPVVKDILSSYIGFFPVADIYTSLNSPLWYFSFIVFYYLIFPILFSRKYPFISAVIIFAASYLLVQLPLPVTKDVHKLYLLHLYAFPLGMLLASLKHPLSLGVNYLWKFSIMLVLFCIFCYTAINSSVGKSVFSEQLFSLISMFSLYFLIQLKNLESRFFSLIGIYSYEIYLIQWPLTYHFDFLYKFMPAYIATLLYIFVFLLFAITIRKVVKTVRVGIYKLLY
ncbi:acyltransferase [candidate division WWE3 bacterium]|nr:acyltransferase [candidate division WWE3 bacterium]